MRLVDRGVQGGVVCVKGAGTFGACVALDTFFAPLETGRKGKRSFPAPPGGSGGK